MSQIHVTMSQWLHIDLSDTLQPHIHTLHCPSDNPQPPLHITISHWHNNNNVAVTPQWHITMTPQSQRDTSSCHSDYTMTQWRSIITHYNLTVTPQSQWQSTITQWIHNHSDNPQSHTAISQWIHNHSDTSQYQNDSTITVTRNTVTVTPQSQWHITISQWLHNHRHITAFSKVR